MSKQEYIIILKGLLLAKNSGECDPHETQTLINHFDKLYQELGE